jgi:hypothetical protein
MNNECFICYENDSKNKKLINLNSKNNYLKNCKCNGYIHQECLDLWFELNQSCPVCRKLMIKKDTSSSICSLNIFKNWYNKYKYYITNIKQFILTLCFFSFMFLSVNQIYIEILYYRNYNNQTMPYLINNTVIQY